MRMLLATFLLATTIHAAEPHYGEALVRATALWPVATGRGVKVATIDTGIDAAHPLLAPRFGGGYDFVRNDAVPDEETKEAHGTFVAGVVAQVAPGAELYSLKIYGNDNSFETPNLVRAIDWCIAHHIDVINMSFAMTVRLDDARRALDRAEAAGIVVVAAAGNHASDVDYPAAFPNVIAVAAIDAHSQRASFSNRGPELDLAAPGVDVYSAAANGGGVYGTIAMPGGVVTAHVFGGSRAGDATGVLVDCGIGRLDQIPTSLAGNVALLRMDATLSLGSALGNVVRGGASAIVVVNSDPNFYYSNINPPGAVPLTASIGSDDLARLPVGGTVRVTSISGDYRFGDGTSFASPHVAGVVALLRELAPDARPSQIRNALVMSARDAGPQGRDDDYGFGIVDAWAAAQLLAPEKLVSPPMPKRRAAGH